MSKCFFFGLGPGLGPVRGPGPGLGPGPGFGVADKSTLIRRNKQKHTEGQKNTRNLSSIHKSVCVCVCVCVSV